MLLISYINFIILIIIVQVNCFPINNNKEDDDLSFQLFSSELTSNKQDSVGQDEKPTTQSDTRCFPTGFVTGGYDITTGGGGGGTNGFGGGGGDFGGGGGDFGGGGIDIDPGLPPEEIARRRRIQAARIARARRIRRMRMMQAARRQAIRREMERRRALANNRPKPNLNGGGPRPMPGGNQPTNTDNIDDTDNTDNADNMDNDGSDGDMQYDQAGGDDYN